MSDLNDLVSSAQDEDIKRQNRVKRKTVNRSVSKNTIKIIQLIVAALVIVFCVSQFMKVMPWIFGVPAGTTRDNIVILLNQAHGQIESSREATGVIPDTLPDDLPDWLIKYRKQEDGYELTATIDNVTVELLQEGDETIIKKSKY